MQNQRCLTAGLLAALACAGCGSEAAAPATPRPESRHDELANACNGDIGRSLAANLGYAQPDNPWSFPDDRPAVLGGTAIIKPEGGSLWPELALSMAVDYRRFSEDTHVDSADAADLCGGVSSLFSPLVAGAQVPANRSRYLNLLLYLDGVPPPAEMPLEARGKDAWQSEPEPATLRGLLASTIADRDDRDPEVIAYTIVERDFMPVEITCETPFTVVEQLELISAERFQESRYSPEFCEPTAQSTDAGPYERCLTRTGQHVGDGCTFVVRGVKLARGGREAEATIGGKIERIDDEDQWAVGTDGARVLKLPSYDLKLDRFEWADHQD